MSLNRAQKQRYNRNLQVPEIGEAGQEKLLSGRVLVVGAGGLGGTILYYLTAMGVGKLGIVDPDRLETSNLQRQILYTENDVGKIKVHEAVRRLEALNSEVEFKAHPVRLTRDNASQILEEGYDVLVDAVDNYQTRLLLNRLGLEYELPLVHGAVYRFEGQVSTFLPREGPCYRCLYPDLDEKNTAASPGPASMVPAAIGTSQVAEITRLLLDEKPALAGRLLCVDVFNQDYSRLEISRNSDCNICGSVKE